MLTVTLPGPLTGPDAVLRFALARCPPEGPAVLVLVRGSGAASSGCVLVDVNGYGGEARLRRIAAALGRRLPVLDILVVRAGRWRSLSCADRICCPEAGHPLPETSAMDRSSP
ncbi:MAG: hypothetical protein ACR2K2_09315 [Mycobacteriales bacterium]